MEYLIPPWRHQAEAMERAKDLPSYLLAFEMGAGKTSTCINILRHKYAEAGRVLRTLIFCPPIVIENWRREILAHSRISRSNITCLVGSGKDRLKLFQRNPTEHIFITNYESLSMEPLYSAFEEWAPEALVFDEIHKCKDHRAKRSKLAEALANPGTKKKPKPRPLVYGLTGSPILNSPMDIFQQYRILDGGQTFGDNFFGFRAKYFRDKNAHMNRQNYFPNWAPIPGALEEISRQMSASSMRVLKKDCLDLPPLVRKIIPIEMDAQQKRIYKDMLDDYVTFFESDGEEHTSVAMLAITKGLRLMQIASGYIKTDAGAEVSVTEEWSPKQTALFELLESLPPTSKVLIWACWRNNYEQIRVVLKALGREFVELHGDVKPDDRVKNIDRFQDDENCTALIGHPGSGGIGCNLTAADYMVFFSRTFSLEHDLQAEARNYRGGSERHKSVTRYDLVSKDTIEEKVTLALANKQSISETILREITMSLKE